MRKLIPLLLGLLIGSLVGYILALQKTIALQEELMQKSKPPRPATRANWWENNQPDTEDEYELTKARANWLEKFLLEYVHPYIDLNTDSILVGEFLTPLHRRLSELEVQNLQKDREMELLFKTQSISKPQD